MKLKSFMTHSNNNKKKQLTTNILIIELDRLELLISTALVDRFIRVSGVP